MMWGITGYSAWMIQRLSAIYIVLYLLFAFGSWGCGLPDDYALWRAWIASPSVWIASVLFFAALFLHAWVGLRDVILDYIHPLWLRFSMLVLLGTVLLVLAIGVLRALFNVVLL